MDNERILELIEKGITPDEIRAMLGNIETNNEGDKNEPSNDAEQGEENAAHESEIKAAEDVAKLIESLTKSVNDVATTVAKMQADNINNANQPQQPEHNIVDLIADFTKDM